MKTFGLAAALVLALASCAFAHALKPTGEPAATLAIVQDGQPAYTIALPQQPTSEEKKAAEDLQHWIKEMTGATLTLGNSEKEVRIATDKALADEAYEIAVDGDDLVLTGGAGRGVINAAYALLEEDLGCRFYTNDSIKLPKGKTAAPMLREYEQALAAGIRYPMTIAFLSKEFLAQASDIFDRATQAAGDDEKLLHRVERAELPIL